MKWLSTPREPSLDSVVLNTRDDMEEAFIDQENVAETDQLYPDASSDQSINGSGQEKTSSSTEGHNEESPVRIYNPGESPFTPENLDQSHQPKVGDLISFFNNRLNYWVDAQIMASQSTRWKNYFNIIYDDGQEDGLYLHPDTRWTFRPTNDERERDTSINIKEHRTFSRDDTYGRHVS